MKPLRPEIGCESVGDVVVFRLRGRIGHEVAEDLSAFLADLRPAHGRKVLVDLSGVHYMSSAAIGTLVKIGSESRLKLAALSEVVRKLLELGEILPLFDIVPSEAEGLESFAEPT